MLNLHWPQIAALCWMGAKGLLVNPLLYLGIGFMIWDARRLAGMERQFFGFRISQPGRQLIRLWFASLVCGIALSVITLAFGITIQPWQAWTVTAVSIVAGAIRLRFSAGVYGIAGLILLSALIPGAATTHTTGFAEHWLASVHAVRLSDWLSLACLLTVAELLLLLMARPIETPVLRKSKRGRPIGAFALQSAFLLPVITVAPGTVALHPALPWAWPFWGAAAAVGVSGWGMPFLAGYSGIHAVLSGKSVVRRQIIPLFVTAVLLGADAWVAHRYDAVYGLLGIVIIVVGREWALLRVRMPEWNGDPKFVPTADGVKVLAVEPGSVAASMELKPGEVIRQINQIPVHTAYDLHFAFDQNPAYAKLEVLDVRGELRLVGKPVYAGERHRLGLILVPERATAYCLNKASCGLFQTLYPRLDAPTVGPEEAWTGSDVPTISQ